MNLSAGVYSVYVKDGDGCVLSENNVKVAKVSYALSIYPILEANCIKSGCHNGDNGATRNWTDFKNVKAKALRIKEKTGNKSMPADIAPIGLPQDEIDLIACWVDDGAPDN